MNTAVNNKFPLMLYRLALTGGEALHGLGNFDMLIVHNEAQLERAEDNGWHPSPAAAAAPKVVDENAPPTPEELRYRLRELGSVVPSLASLEELKALVLVAEKFGIMDRAPTPAPTAAPTPAPTPTPTPAPEPSPAPTPTPAPEAAPAAKASGKR